MGRNRLAQRLWPQVIAPAVQMHCRAEGRNGPETIQALQEILGGREGDY
jgi:hypothetical protein